jgi:hypothetical protein
LFKGLPRVFFIFYSKFCKLTLFWTKNRKKLRIALRLYMYILEMCSRRVFFLELKPQKIQMWPIPDPWCHSYCFFAVFPPNGIWSKFKPVWACYQLGSVWKQYTTELKFGDYAYLESSWGRPPIFFNKFYEIERGTLKNEVIFNFFRNFIIIFFRFVPPFTQLFKGFPRAIQSFSSFIWNLKLSIEFELI